MGLPALEFGRASTTLTIRAVFWKSVKLYIHWQFEKLLDISAHFDSFSLPWMP